MSSRDSDPVDVLIIGAGASGAAVAWSLAETRMRIVCMEQGDWTNPSEYPTNFPDWEQRLTERDHIDPNVRARPTDYPINNDESPISVVNFNGVGGGTILYAAHFPRLHPSDFRVKSLDGVADDWPVDYDALEPYFAENDRMMGVSGLAKRRQSGGGGATNVAIHCPQSTGEHTGDLLRRAHHILDNADRARRPGDDAPQQ